MAALSWRKKSCDIVLLFGSRPPVGVVRVTHLLRAIFGFPHSEGAAHALCILYYSTPDHRLVLIEHVYLQHSELFV